MNIDVNKGYLPSEQQSASASHPPSDATKLIAEMVVTRKTQSAYIASILTELNGANQALHLLLENERNENFNVKDELIKLSAKCDVMEADYLKLYTAFVNLLSSIRPDQDSISNKTKVEAILIASSAGGYITTLPSLASNEANNFISSIQSNIIDKG